MTTDSAPRTQPVEACPICQGAGAAFMKDLPDSFHATPGRFSYSRCQQCGSVYQNPRVVDEDLPGTYPENYYTHEPPPGGQTGNEPSPSVGLRERVRDWVRAVVQAQLTRRDPSLAGRVLSWVRPVREGAFRGLIDPVIPRGLRPGRALEIGPGSGWELRLLSEAGWEVEGLEWDPLAAENAARSSGVTVHHGGVPAGLPDQGRWSLIYLSHVFEHLTEPGEMWRLLVSRLEPGGRLVIVVPNPRSLGARMWGEDWFAWEAPRHLCMTTRKGFETLAAGEPGRLHLRSRARISALIHERSRERRGSGPRGLITRAVGQFEALLGELGFAVGDELVVVFERAKE